MEKSQAIFMSDEAAIKNAYAPDIRAALLECLDILPGYYDAAYFSGSAQDETKFSHVEYVFSTWGMPALEEAAIRRLFPNLKAVFYAAGTVQAFARPFMKCGVRIFSAWGANAVPVAEVAAAEIVLANKGFFQTLHRGGVPDWPEHDEGKPYPGNYDTPVGIIGAGMIGKLVIRMLKNYRLKVYVFDPFLPRESADALGVTKVDALPELFSRCQVISNHLANNEATRGMIDAACFDRMGNNAVFLNTGRGQQVVEADLIAALKACPARAAVLDVTWPEPPAAGSELYTLPNVFLTPHMAGSLGAEVQRMGQYMYEEFLAFSEKRETRYLVTEQMLETMA